MGFATAVILIAGGWDFLSRPLPIAYLGLWSLWLLATARWRRPGVESEYDKSQTLWMKGLAIFSIPFLLAAPPLEYRLFSGPLPRHGWLNWVGLLIFAVGVVLQAASMRELGRLYTVRLGLQPKHRLVQTGPYRFLRHPGYLSYLLCLYGIGFALGSLLELGFALGVTIFIFFRMAKEETMLATAFGEEWTNYCRRTRRLIPFLY